VSRALREYLDHPDRPAGALSYHELQGFLFAVASCPELADPSEWMPMVFGEEGPTYAGMTEARAVVGGVMDLYTAITTAVGDGTIALPVDCGFREDVLDNLHDDAPVSLWARGFVQGHHWLEESWDAYLTDEIDEEFGATLMALSFFASPNMAEALRAETGHHDLGELARTMCELMPTAIAEYASLGRTIHHVLQEAAADEARGEEAPDPDEACPCGSGRRFRDCCADPGGPAVH
jgi:uncharacterized protein